MDAHTMIQNLRQRLDNQSAVIESLREENLRLREENDTFRERLIAFTGRDPR